MKTRTKRRRPHSETAWALVMDVSGPMFVPPADNITVMTFDNQRQARQWATARNQQRFVRPVRVRITEIVPTPKRKAVRK